MHHTVRQFADWFSGTGVSRFKESDIDVAANNNCTSNLFIICVSE